MNTDTSAAATTTESVEGKKDWSKPGPFRVGGEYLTQSGETVRFVSVSQAGTPYETMADEDGIHRYTSRDFGRVTGTPHDYSYPGNTPPPAPLTNSEVVVSH